MKITNSDDDVIEAGSGIESVLFIPIVSTENGGRYVCSAELDGTVVSTEAYVSVTTGKTLFFLNFLEDLACSATEDMFEVVILGAPEVEIDEGAFHSLVCDSNQNSSSISWTFDGIPIQVL